MADPLFHAMLGACTGTFLGMLLFRRRTTVSSVLLRAFTLAVGMAVFAVIPNVLGRLGLPQAWKSAWFMNLFLLHPLVSRAQHGGTVWAYLGLGMCYCTLYGYTLAGLWRQARRSTDD